MSDETGDVEVGGGDEGEGAESASEALRAFVEEDDKAEAKPEAKPAEKAPEPKREAKPEKKAEPKAEAKPAEKKDEPPAPKPKRKVKVDGEEIEVDEEELERGYMRAKAATKRFQEAAQLKSQMEEAQRLAKTDPVAALQRLGLSPEEYRKAAEQYVFKTYSEEFDPQTGQPLTPEQKELAKLRNEASQRQAEKDAEERKVREAEEQKTRQDSERHWVQTIVKHLEASGSPKHILPRVAHHLSTAIENDAGLDPVDLLEDATSLAWDDIQAEHAALYEQMPWEAIKGRFPTLVEKIRKGIVSDFKSRKAAAAPQVVEIPEEKRERKEKPIRSSRDALASFLHG